jgi:hypothetical protein
MHVTSDRADGREFTSHVHFTVRRNSASRPRFSCSVHMLGLVCAALVPSSPHPPSHPLSHPHHRCAIYALRHSTKNALITTECDRARSMQHKKVSLALNNCTRACFDQPLNAITRSHFCLKSFNLQQISNRFQSQWECITVGANFLGASSRLRLRKGLSQHHAGASFRYNENSLRLCLDNVISFGVPQ